MLTGKSFTTPTIPVLPDVLSLKIMAMLPEFGQELRQTCNLFKKMPSLRSNLSYTIKSLQAVVCNKKGRTLMWAAANLGYSEIIIELLLVDSSQALTDLDKPLMAAIDNGHFKIVDLILKEKAKTSTNKANPYETINIGGRQNNILSLAISIYRKRTSKKPFPPFLDWLLADLKSHPNFNFQDSLNNALWEAVGLNTKDIVNWQTHLFTGEIIKRLLEAKADPNIRNEQKQTPFEAVINTKNVYYTTVAASLAPHADIKNPQQATQYLSIACTMAYHQSTSKALASTIRILLEKGADMLSSRALEHITYHSAPEALEVMVRALQTKGQYLKIQSLLMLMPPTAYGRFNINSQVLFDALRALPVVGKNLLDKVLSKRASIASDFKYEKFPEYEARLENLSNIVKAIDAFKINTLNKLIKQELKYLKYLQEEEKSGKKTKATSTTEAKSNEKNKPVYQRLQELWKCKPKKIEIRAAKNAVLGVLVEYLQKPDGLDKKTEIDAFDIIELAVQLFNRLAPKYAKLFQELLMTPKGTPYLPFKFRPKIIKELKIGLQEFLKSLSKEETYEFDAIQNRTRQFLLVAPLLAKSGSPAPSITTHLLRASSNVAPVEMSSRTAPKNETPLYIRILTHP